MALVALFAVPRLAGADAGAGAQPDEDADRDARDRAEPNERITVGSKAFPESWILAEAVTDLARAAGAAVTHTQNLGATEIAHAALVRGNIDLYPEYTGTLREVVLRGGGGGTMDTLREALAARGEGVTDPLGFDDGYALAVLDRDPRARGITTLSQLRGTTTLRAGFTHEFLGRTDGYPGLAARYGLDLRPTGVQHELALDALARGDLDLVDVYTTDPQIDRLGLRLLDDDRAFFPRYDAVLVYRADLPARAPRAFTAITKLAGAVGPTVMRKANARVALEHASVDDAAHELLHDALGMTSADGAAAGRASRAHAMAAALADVGRNTLHHLELVGLALLASVLLGVPLGIVAARSRVLALVTTSLAGLVQTIPSLALLALLVPVFGIGTWPALAALFLYGLLPIVRGTQTGLTTLSPALAEAAEALGLSPVARLASIDLPLASPQILGGIRTSAVIGVGTATLAALVGAEGLGGPILQGIALRDTARVLEGAVPAALLALAVDALVALLARVVVPRGLRLSR